MYLGLLGEGFYIPFFSRRRGYYESERNARDVGQVRHCPPS